MALEQNKQCFLHRWLCPRTPGVFSLAIQGVTFYPRSQQKRATPTWCYSPHSTTLRFGALSSVAHTLMRYLDLTCGLVSVQALPKHLHHLLPAFRVARFTRSAPHRHLLFQVTTYNILYLVVANIPHRQDELFQMSNWTGMRTVHKRGGMAQSVEHTGNFYGNRMVAWLSW